MARLIILAPVLATATPSHHDLVQLFVGADIVVQVAIAGLSS
jgi:hypothetical protein